jgi:hypothetical protein
MTYDLIIIGSGLTSDVIPAKAGTQAVSTAAVSISKTDLAAHDRSDRHHFIY